MLIFLRGDVPHIDDGFGEVRPLREEEAQVLALSVEALSAPDPDAEAVFSAEVQPHLATWRRALALSAVGSQEVPLPELDAVATVLAHGDLDRAAYLGGLMAAARAWRGTLEGNVQDLAKARRWITAHPNGPGSRGIPLLIESTADGGAKIIGGAGGKLNGQKLGSLKPGAGGEAKNTREHKAEAEAAAKKPNPPLSRHKITDPWMGHALPAGLEKHKAKAARFVDEYHAMRQATDEARARGDTHVDARRFQAAARDLAGGDWENNDFEPTAAQRGLKQWADAFLQTAEKHRTVTSAEQAAHDEAEKDATAFTQHLKDEAWRRRYSLEAMSEREDRRLAREKQTQERLAREREERAAREPEERKRAEERLAREKADQEAAAQAKAAEEKAKEERLKTAEASRVESTANRALTEWRASAGKAGPGRARAMLEAKEAGKPWPHAVHPNDAKLLGPDGAPNLAGQRLLAQLRADGVDPVEPAPAPPPTKPAPRRSGGQGGPPPGAQMPLFKARMVMTMPQRLAKSTLAPVATPAQHVTVGDTLAFWRTNDSGMGVLEIPLKSGKSLLVLASDLALALREGAAELALVLKGLAPARALISMPGRFKTARKPA